MKWDTGTFGEAIDEIERIRLQWTGMRDEVNLCHAEIARLRAINAELVAVLTECVEFFGDDKADEWDCLKKARAALAKARGEA